MGLRAEYEQAVREKNARAKKEEDFLGRDHLLCEEVLTLYTDERYTDANKIGGMYYYSLPIQLPPESQELVKELIELCPPHLWRSLPKEVQDSDIKAVKRTSGWSDSVGAIGAGCDYNICRYSPDRHYLQFRLGDGSIHIGAAPRPFEEHVEWVKPAFRLTQRGKQEASQEAAERSRRQAKAKVVQKARQMLEQTARNPMLAGARECMVLRYASGRIHPTGHGGEYALENILVIFRDGTVYDPYPNAYYNPGRVVWPQGESPFKRRFSCEGSVPLFREFCSKRVKQWAQLT